MSSSKGLKNIGFGLAANVLTIIVGVIIPRLVLVNLGSEANGLLSSVGNILTYLSLLEAGVGTATLQALYKPIAIKDYNSINGVMSATDFFYRRTGKIYLAIVLALSVIYTALVHTNLSRVDVFIVVLLSGLTGVINYYFQGKLRIFLQAEGKTYVNTNIATMIYVFSSISKAILLYMGFNVVAIQLSSFLFNFVQMIVYVVYMRKHYPWLNTRVKPNFDAISQRNAVLVHQVSDLIFRNTDVLLLTIFTSLKEVSVYSMYAMIYGIVKSVAVVMYDSYTYALGQSFNTDKNRFIRIFDAYEVMSMLITFSLYCICRALMNPFLALYTAGVNDIRYVDKYLPWLFAIFYLLHNGRTSSATVINISQHFEDTKWRSVIESCINLTVSIICVVRFGVYGVLLGTIAALLYRTNDMIIFASRILKRSCLITYKRWLTNLGLFFASSIILDQFDLSSDTYIHFLLIAIVVSFFVIFVFVVVNVLIERESVGYILGFVKKTMGRHKS